jgi:nucleotidyltransferase AbiEii toxin of type IV toxin-antitoxin system
LTEDRYSTPAGVGAAIAAAARKAHATDPSGSVSDRIRQEYFRRFLSRIFSEEGDSDWLLKGGTGVLARIGSARTTTDVDLFRKSRSLDAALDDLRRLAAIDLGDFFRFEYTAHETAVGGQQTYTKGYHVTFDVYVGASGRGSLSVDLVVNVVVTDDPTVTPPANALDLPKLTSHDYRLYPVVDQIADKVCATLALYNGRPSSREWDLVDLVVLAVSEDVEGIKLRRAIVAEARVRNVDLPNSFVVPSQWGRRYAKDARPIPACADFRSIDLAVQLMQTFLEPVFRDEVAGQTWNPANCAWTG